MKKMPEYMDNILNFLAETAEKKKIMSKEGAYKLYKQELFDESLTAKANPAKSNPYPICEAYLKKNPKAVKDVVNTLVKEGKSAEEIHGFLIDNNFKGSLVALKKYMKNPSSSEDEIQAETNPSYKEFQEIYEVAAQKFNDSTLAEYLGKMKKGLYQNKYLKSPKETYAASGKVYENKGRAFFEELRKFCVSATDEIYTSSMFGKNKNRKDAFFYNPKTGRLESGKTGKHPSDREMLGSREIPKLLGNMSSKEWETREKSKKARLITTDEYAGRDERTDQLIEIEAERYLKIMMQSVIFAMNEKLFDLDKSKIQDLLGSSLPLLFDASISPQAQRKVYAWANSEAGRTAYTHAMLIVIRKRLLDGDGDLFAPLSNGESNIMLQNFFDLRDAPEDGKQRLVEFMGEKKKGR